MAPNRSRLTLSAEELRSMGIDSVAARDDRDLVESVQILLELGYSLDELVGHDFPELAGAALLRPGADRDAKEFVSGENAFAHRLRQAMGVAPGLSQRKLTEAEIEAGLFFREMADLVGEDQVLIVLRVLGSSSSRVARAATSMLRLQFETPLADEGGRLADVLAGYIDLIEFALPRFLEASSTIIRSHFAQVAQTDNIWTVDSTRSATLEQKVVGFADLVGFTAFTERVSAQQFMRAIAGFEEDVHAAVIDNGGTVVKLIGDEVMFVAPNAPAALAIARELSEPGRRSGDLEGMRVGLASGEVINSGGDYFGTVVNVAARIVNLAFTHAIVVTTAVAEALAGTVQTESLGKHELRGIRDPVELFRLRP